MKIRELYEKGLAILEKSDVPDSSIDTKYIIEYITGISTTRQMLEADRDVDEDTCSKYFETIDKRATRYPLQYITGEQEFMGLIFKVNEHVLIPRQDTEILVARALEVCENKRVLDMCTGSGCIAISIASLGKPEKVSAVDISPEAIEVAKNNAKINNVSDKIIFILSDLFDKVEKEEDDGRFDVIISNPPYIAHDTVATLMPEVRDYEPNLALEADNEGLFFYEKIIKESPDYLKKEGMLMFEIGYEQGKAVADMMTNAGFTQVQVVKDYAGLDRVVCGKLL